MQSISTFMGKPAFQSESDLIAGLREGDQEAFSQIFKKYWCHLYTSAYSKVHSKEIAEEIVQELFVCLWDKRNLLLITNLGHYLNSSLKNKCIDHIRKKATQDKYFEYCKKHFPPLVANEESVDELQGVLEKGLSELPEKTRRIFIMNRLEGVPNSEIARTNHLSEKSVEYHVTKSIKQLRNYLRDFLSLGIISLSVFF